MQLAKIAGARVIATTSTMNVSMVRSLGADEVIDYSTGDFRKVVKEELSYWNEPDPHVILLP